MIELGEHGLHVRRAALVIARDHGVAAAKRAERFAERQVNVERQRRRVGRERDVERLEPGGSRPAFPASSARPDSSCIAAPERRTSRAIGSVTRSSCECFSDRRDESADRRFRRARQDAVTEPADPAAASIGIKRADRRQELRDRGDEIVVRQEQPRGIEIALHESRAGRLREQRRQGPTASPRRFLPTAPRSSPACRATGCAAFA